MVDGVRIYLTADNRLDFGRFLTADLAHQLLDLDVTYAAVGGLEVGVGFKNLLDDDYELAWGFPQPGRAFYVRTRVAF
jgi:outer membrane cobalamin receptor